MRVAVVGNMNNGMFALTKHLRDRDVNAELFFARGYDHFHPKADTYEIADLRFCHEVSWFASGRGFYGVDPRVIRRDMHGYDIVIGTADEAAALALAGIPIHIYFPYGDDVLRYAHPPERQSLLNIARELRAQVRQGKPNLAILGRMRHGRRMQYVRQAICTAAHVVVDRANHDWDRQLAALPLQGTLHRSAWPVLHPATYRNGSRGVRRGDVHWRSIVDALRGEYDLSVLYHGRHEWTSDANYNSKNTHHLVLGFAEFVQRYGHLRPCLVTVEYGTDVAATKALIAKLGVQESVVWFPLMYRKDLMYLAHHVDVCSGEFSRSYLTFGTILEAISLAKPVIHYRDDSLYDGPLYPILNAREPVEIAGALAAYAEDPDTWRRKGLEAQAWLDEYVVRRPLDLICRLLSEDGL